MKNNERDERKTRKVLVPLATLAVAAAVAVGSGATWTSTSTSKMTVNAGSIIHSNDHGGMTLKITGLLPGHKASGTVTIKNTGDSDATLTMVRTQAANALGSNLTLSITEVTTPATTPVPATFPSLADPTVVSLDDTFTAGESHTYTFEVELNANTPESEQGKSASATYTFKTADKNTNATADWLAGIL